MTRHLMVSDIFGGPFRSIRNLYNTVTILPVSQLDVEDPDAMQAVVNDTIVLVHPNLRMRNILIGLTAILSNGGMDYWSDEVFNDSHGQRGALQTQLNHVPLFKVKIKFISLATFDDRPSRGSQTLDADSAELRMALIDGTVTTPYPYRRGGQDGLIRYDYGLARTPYDP
uniref:Uncharacterized protein n=1 Tax=Moniliophthora roreri TaxID=221103 RepID=A0A0W0FNM7_MONRR